MEILARHRFASISPQKVRLIADQVRGLSVEKASALLSFSRKEAAALVKKVMDSAVANAEHNNGADIDELLISRVFVDDGPRAKRFHARARGRGNQILKRYCHITVAVSDEESR